MITLVGNVPNAQGNLTAHEVRLGDDEMPITAFNTQSGFRTRVHNLLTGYPQIETSGRTATRFRISGTLAAERNSSGQDSPVNVNKLQTLRYWEQSGQQINVIIQEFQHTRISWQKIDVTYLGYIVSAPKNETQWLVGIPRRLDWNVEILITTEPTISVVLPRPPVPIPPEDMQ